MFLIVKEDVNKVNRAEMYRAHRAHGGYRNPLGLRMYTALSLPRTQTNIFSWELHSW